MIFKKNDLVYIPLLGTSIYKIENIVDNKIQINGKFIEFYSNFLIYNQTILLDNDIGNFNYHTGYLTNEGKILIGTENPTNTSEVLLDIPHYIGNITSKFVFEANLKNQQLLELLTGDKYESVLSPIEVSIKLLKEGPIFCKASSDLIYEDLIKETEIKQIVRYDPNNNLFYDLDNNTYTLVIPLDIHGNEIKEIKYD